MHIDFDNIFEDDFYDKPEYDPQLIDKELAAACRPHTTFSKESHQIVFYNGIGYFI